MTTHVTEFTYDDDGNLDFDRTTQTVRADDGSRVSLWDCAVSGADACPLCTSGRLIVSFGGDEGIDMLMCSNAVRLPTPACDLIIERAQPAGDALSGAGAHETRMR